MGSDQRVLVLKGNPGHDDRTMMFALSWATLNRLRLYCDLRLAGNVVVDL